MIDSGVDVSHVDMSRLHHTPSFANPLSLTLTKTLTLPLALALALTLKLTIETFRTMFRVRIRFTRVCDEH